MPTLTRVTFALLCCALVLALAIMAGLAVFGSLFWGLLIWAIAMAYAPRAFLVSVPEVTGLLTINLLNGELRPYGTGIHFRFPWEQVKEGNYINLRTITPEQRKESYPSADGPAMIVKWSFQYIPRLELLPRFIAVDQTTIDKGLGDVGSSFLSAEIARRNTIDCKENQAVIERGLQEAFEGPFSRSAVGETVEQFYGIDIVRISLADVDYDEKFQRARTTEQVMERLRGSANKIHDEHGEISSKDALNAVMIVNGDVTKNIQEVEGEGGQALAALLMAMARGGSHEGRGDKKGSR